MKYSDLTRRITGEGSSAWDIHFRAQERLARGEDVVILSVGDPDFDTPAAIVDTACAELKAGATHYADHRGEQELQQVLAARHTAQTGVSTDPEQVVVVAGAQCGLYVAAQCLLDPGDEVIVPEPMYVTYEAFLQATGARVVNVPLLPELHFNIDPEAIAAKVTERTRAIFINSPHNPTGAAVNEATWQALAELCVEHDLWLITDEVYADLMFEGEHFHPGQLPGMSERTVTVSSLSKSHAMTGWRLGWVIGPREFAVHAGNLTLCMLYGSPAFVQRAAVTALTAELPELEEMRQAYRGRRDLMVARIKSIPGVNCHTPAGGMFMMLDVRELGVSADTFAERLLDEFGVSVLVGEAFGPSARGHVRASFCVSEADLDKACARIAACAEAFLSEADG
ncbi:Arginine--pyruvate transaminase AruH [Microbulbifer aggregans]|uniref:Aminotransferase n=1 Tax=Microbulbifer aggregans TaxID=1769779 RepID=A0A1C9WAR5_9GAMM|nr:pyridoxal phosphate-dependent aminotransferase [Microbulbifer aggregans]AOS98245.1 Arginine--pyruvate transaminase AruH [Microbulbifer aggregans]